MYGLLAWVGDLHSLNSVLAWEPAPDAAAEPSAGAGPRADNPQWSAALAGLWPRLDRAVAVPTKTGSA
ncbi:hypothetical protein GCM10010329_77640 [Streptomyces spiroverticillatus]|uniref:Uncharacterized protein n=1 Tax=Streptomyces finlayi TaxID=67296 RepID=A0A918X592_9ACTN|nr:hypothetical protein GCM10010329_77640 [Streptomyces spiroverticillatus]GHD13475.1 hypothetical protein GCM10010334_71710 [Streptomyces finlayi]